MERRRRLRICAVGGKARRGGERGSTNDRDRSRASRGGSARGFARRARGVTPRRLARKMMKSHRVWGGAHRGVLLGLGRHGRGGLGRRRRLGRGRDVGGRRRRGRRGGVSRAATALRRTRHRDRRLQRACPVDATSASISRPRGVSDDVPLPRVRASTEREPGTCDVHVSPTRGARGCVQLRSARGRNAPAVGPRPFQIETLVEQQLFRTLREGKRTSFPSPPGTKLSFSHGAQSRKRGISLKKCTRCTFDFS